MHILTWSALSQGPEVVILSRVLTCTVVRHSLTYVHDISVFYGAPIFITTDGGQEFDSATF